MRDLDNLKVDRNSIEVVEQHDDGSSDLHYWLAQNPVDRLKGIEALRQSFFPYDPISERLPRVFEAPGKT